jgi:hypothetical protein
MGLTPQELLQKATLGLGDFGTATTAPLTIEQADEFLRLAITPQALLSDVRTVRSKANKWQESTIDFSARILRPGTGGTRLIDTERVKPTTGVVEISTVLVRGEVPVTDEVLEDQVEGAGFGNTLSSMIAEGSGRDIEELLLCGQIGSADPYLALTDGWVKLLQGAGGNVFDATAVTQSGYQSVFRSLLTRIPAKNKRDMANWRFYVPNYVEEFYRDALSARNTDLGDISLGESRDIRYQGITLKSVPMMPVTLGTPDKSYIILTHRLNLYAGFKREIRIETFRDPREGATSFVVTARVDAAVAVPGATAIATNVNVEPS